MLEWVSVFLLLFFVGCSSFSSEVIVFTKRPATVVLLSCCRFHRFLDLLFSAVVLSVVLLYYIINISFQLAQEVLNKDYNSSLKPHLHDIHFGCGTPKDGHAERYFGDGPPDFLPCRCEFCGTRSEKIRWGRTTSRGGPRMPKRWPVCRKNILRGGITDH